MTIPSSRSLILWISIFSITSPSADFGRLRKTSDFFGRLRTSLGIFGNDGVVFKNPSTPRIKISRLYLRKSWQVYTDDVSLPRSGHSASDRLKQISHAVQPIRSTTQIWVVTRHQYGISALLSQTLFGEETSGSVAKCRLFSQATTTKIIKHKDSVYVEEEKGSLNSSGFPQDFPVP